MSQRAHLCLRIVALALLVGAAFWPRDRGVVATDELGRSVREGVMARTSAAHATTAAARLVSGPGRAKVVVAQADQSDLTN